MSNANITARATANQIAQGIVARATIKERLLDDIRAGEWNPNLLGKRHGLNGHDLVKNLEQLRKEGFIAFKWGMGDRIDRVWIPKGKQNMDLLRGHTRTNGHIDYIEFVADAINQLPWGDRGFRVWSKPDVVKSTGLKGEQVAHAMQVLRESGRMQQLGGGGRGLPIVGVRWRGERAPDLLERIQTVESATEAPEPAPEPSGDRWPMARAAVNRWKKMILATELLKQIGQEGLAEQLGETEEWKVMSYVGHELEGLLKEVDNGS